MRQAIIKVCLMFLLMLSSCVNQRYYSSSRDYVESVNSSHFTQSDWQVFAVGLVGPYGTIAGYSYETGKCHLGRSYFMGTTPSTTLPSFPNSWEGSLALGTLVLYDGVLSMKDEASPKAAFLFYLSHEAQNLYQNDDPMELFTGDRIIAYAATLIDLVEVNNSIILSDAHILDNVFFPLCDLCQVDEDQWQSAADIENIQGRKILVALGLEWYSWKVFLNTKGLPLASGISPLESGIKVIEFASLKKSAKLCVTNNICADFGRQLKIASCAIDNQTTHGMVPISPPSRLIVSKIEDSIIGD